MEWNMDLIRLSALTRYWTQHPALHQMIQKFLGIEGDATGAARSPSSDSAAVNSSADLEEFMQMFSGAGGTTH